MKLKDLEVGMYVKTSYGEVVQVDSISNDRIGASNSDYYAWYCSRTGKLVCTYGKLAEEKLEYVLEPKKLKTD